MTMRHILGIYNIYSRPIDHSRLILLFLIGVATWNGSNGE